MAYLIPTLLSMLCICLVICSATVMPHWPRMIIGSIALVVLARCVVAYVRHMVAPHLLSTTMAS